MISQPDEATIARISQLKPSDLVDDVLSAVDALGGEAQRVEIIDRALSIGGWTQQEEAVVSWYSGAARKWHLRTLADYAVTVAKDRGQLTEGTARGRWRLVGAPAVQAHPHGRVFIASQGVGDDPVDDDWAAEDQTHVWFSQRSLRLSRGDHLFVLGARRHSAVLGLFEITSGGTTTSPLNPWNAKRWPWAIQVRALASVPPPVADPVPGVIGPRGAAQQVTDPAKQRALYAAVQAHAIDGESPAGSTPDQDHSSGAILRRPRPFDPQRPPVTAKSGSPGADPEEALARQEKARAGHHDLLVALDAALRGAGWSTLEEVAMAIDLRGVTPTGEPVIFEAKTIAGGNETRQCRSGLAQLLEYRLEYGLPEDALCLVVNAPVAPRRRELLGRLGVAVALVDGDKLTAVNDVAAAIFHRTAPPTNA